jgi:hypothetical protein
MQEVPNSTPGTGRITYAAAVPMNDDTGQTTVE